MSQTDTRPARNRRAGRNDQWAVNRIGRGLVLLTVGLVVGLVPAACSSDESADELASLSPAAREGRALVESRGCVACHGEDGEGGVGPGWVGLVGSQVELEDGTMVLADADYLTRAIAAPDEQIVAGYAVAMPANDLTDAEIAAVIAYLEELR